MSQSCIVDAPRLVIPAGWRFALATLALSTGAALLAGLAPLGFSIVTVFLFAGPHNWMEARYFLGRLPARWGKLQGFFVLGFAGIFALTATHIALPWLGSAWNWNDSLWKTAISLWDTALVLWLLTLIQVRSGQNPRRDWSWTWPAGFVLIALAWLQPEGWALCLVYLHPLIALWILDRELCRSRPGWRPAYHVCLLCLPLFLGLLWLRLADTPSLPGSDAFTVRITQHAGADLLPGVSSHLLVALHTFLEMLHYSVWLLAIPLVSLGSRPWRFGATPLARRSRLWRWAIGGVLAVGALSTLLLWCGFLADYPLTRDVYFTVALIHVLAEAPFLLRAL